jgi:replicative DNA helicase
MINAQNYFQSPEKERSLLGSILLHNDILDEHSIDERLFFEESHRRIFGEVQRVRGRGATANIVEVALGLPDIAAHVSGMTDYAISDIGHCIAELRACEQARGTARLLREIEDKQKILEPAAQIVEFATEKVMGLTDCHDVSYRPMGEAIKDAITAIAARAANKNDISGVPSGIPKLDAMTDGFQDGEYIILGARPSVGKTALALSITREAATAGKRVGFLSLEMSDVAIMMRYLAAMSQIPLNCLRKGLLGRNHHAALQNAAIKMQEQKVWLGDVPNMRMNDIVNEARMLKRREKVDILVIDYLGLISMEQKDMPRWEMFSSISQRLKSLARELKIPLLVLAQLRREAQDRKPSLADLRETGSIEQDADQIIFIHRDGEPGSDGIDKVDLIVGKNRNGEIGTINLTFDKPKMRFYENNTPNPVDREQRSPYSDR